MGRKIGGKTSRVKVKTHQRWGPWFGLRRGCWQPPHCLMHGSERHAPAGASRITPAAPSIFHSRYFCSPACCTQQEKKSNKDFFFNPEQLLPCTEANVSLTSLTSHRTAKLQRPPRNCMHAPRLLHHPLTQRHGNGWVSGCTRGSRRITSCDTQQPLSVSPF